MNGYDQIEILRPVLDAEGQNIAAAYADWDKASVARWADWLSRNWTVCEPLLLAVAQARHEAARAARLDWERRYEANVAAFRAEGMTKGQAERRAHRETK